MQNKIIIILAAGLSMGRAAEIEVKNNCGQGVAVEAAGGAVYLVPHGASFAWHQPSNAGLIALLPAEGGPLALDVSGASSVSGSHFTAFLGTNAVAGGATLATVQSRTNGELWGVGFMLGLTFAGFGWGVRFVRGIFTQGPDI